VLNTVARARDVFDQLRKLIGNDRICHLLHSRFRPAEKQRWAELLQSQIPSEGRILIATQVIEAGVDISSSLLITDLAPWASMVQRFGRCNRAGEFDAARIFWIDQRPKVEPYEADELAKAAEILGNLKSASPCDLPERAPDYEPTHVLRKQDLMDLFDTSPDLSGYDLDVSRFIRSGQDRDVLLAWRSDEPVTKDDAPGRDELCSAPIHEVKTYLQKKAAWTWNALSGEWTRASADHLRPGMMLVLLAKDGGYDTTRGLDLKSTKAVTPILVATTSDEGNDDDPRTFLHYTQSLVAHSREVQATMQGILDALGMAAYRDELLMVALHHDWGKTHPVFQATMNPDGCGTPLAKSATQRTHGRKRFRHELASALALLQTGAPDLVAYLVAAHHGKIRLSIRALPDEDKPESAGVKFARGIHDGDVLPEVQLGDAVKPLVKLDLEPMPLGASSSGEPSWMERMLTLRDEIGIFRLALLEGDDRRCGLPSERRAEGDAFLTQRLILKGCTTEPMAGYLKALAVFRLVSEQADSHARCWWAGNAFCLESKFDPDALSRFFLDEYLPTPIVAPWNGGSGFVEGDRRIGLDAILASGLRGSPNIGGPSGKSSPGLSSAVVT
jgi:CRISPR-associated endonuclease/helicase Cas3